MIPFGTDSETKNTPMSQCAVVQMFLGNITWGKMDGRLTKFATINMINSHSNCIYSPIFLPFQAPDSTKSP